jgi:hypothetical protein
MNAQEKSFYIRGYRFGGCVGPKADELESQPQRYDPETGAALWNSGSIVVFVGYGELDRNTLDPIQSIINIEASYSLLRYRVIYDTVYILRNDSSFEEEIWHDIPSTDETQAIFDAKLLEYKRRRGEYQEVAGILYEQALDNLGLTQEDEPDDYEGQNAFVDKISEHIEIPDPHLYNVSLPELERILPSSVLPDSLIIDVIENFKTLDH